MMWNQQYHCGRRLVTAAWVASIFALAPVLPVAAGEWPMYRGDAARQAHVQQPLALPLSRQWSYQAAAAPRPAWPRSRRMMFDRAFQIVTAGDRVLFGSSVDGIVYSLDAQTGKEVWHFFTDGPIRFAPAIWRDRAFVASDDGNLYALRLTDGKLLWKKRGVDRADQVLGNESMISKWPARGGPVVADDTVYFAAGIWPSEGIYIYALDAATGRMIWCNSKCGSMHIPQPHPTAEAESGVSAQGYLVVAGDHLLVPTGRAVPASLERKTGRFEYFHLQKYGHYGESPTMAVDDLFLNGGLSFGSGDGLLVDKLGAGLLAATDQGIVRAAGTTLTRYRWAEKNGFDRKGKRNKTRSLQADFTAKKVPEAVAIVVAGDQVILGCHGRVAVYDITKQAIGWQSVVDGAVFGLAVTGDRLLVSTDQGTIYSFTSSTDVVALPAYSLRGSPRPAESPARAGRAAEEIIQNTGISAGYCLDLGCGDGQLAVELAQRTQLQIIAVDSDQHNVDVARRRLIEAKLYGNRVQVQRRDLAATGYPRYFADLIVSGRSTGVDSTQVDQGEVHRLQRPYGGMSCFGPPGAMTTSKRGALVGAGSWTHQYADPANTANSGDPYVRGKLGMLWYRDVDFVLSQRHGRPPAPLFRDGTLFHEGLNGLIAVNAYNGSELWRFQAPGVLRAYDGDELMGVAGTGSNFCVGSGSVYLRHGADCFRLDAVTGAPLRKYKVPPMADASDKPDRPWGYIALAGNILFGTVADNHHIVTYRYLNRGGDMSKLLTESSALFALDPNSGKRLWSYVAHHSIRHNAIAIANDRAVLIDRPLAEFDRLKKHPSATQPTGTLVALDARTGRTLWKNEDDIYGTMLAISSAHDVVLMSYQPTRFRLDSEVGGRMAAYRLSDGTRLWDIKADYASRPMINDTTIYAQGGAWELLTGKPVPFAFKRSYGCGILASSKYMLLFRSATLGYYDLAGARTIENYGGMRPGCWINTLPVGGIVLVPDATAGCECSYLNRCWIALEPLK